MASIYTLEGAQPLGRTAYATLYPDQTDIVSAAQGAYYRAVGWRDGFGCAGPGCGCASCQVPLRDAAGGGKGAAIAAASLLVLAAGVLTAITIHAGAKEPRRRRRR